MKFKDIANYIGFVLLLASSLSLYYVWFSAFFNGGQVLVTTNEFNEMTFEFWLLTLGFPFMVYAWFRGVYE